MRGFLDFLCISGSGGKIGTGRGFCRCTPQKKQIALGGTIISTGKAAKGGYRGREGKLAQGGASFVAVLHRRDKWP